MIINCRMLGGEVMKIWKEYNDNIINYFDWLEINYKSNDKKISVFSYNASDIHIIKEEFFNYCKNEVLTDLTSEKEIYIYLLALEKINDVNSKVERYKKCWKKISSEVDLKFLQLGAEIKVLKSDGYYYFAIAKTELYNLDKILRILDMKNRYCIFISDKDYMIGDEETANKISESLVLNKYGEIDYRKLIEFCIKNDDIVCRYGTDSIGIELAFIINYDSICNFCAKKSNK